MSLVNIQRQSFASLKDKIVVLTGGSKGIGAAFLAQLADVGAKVIYGNMTEPKSAPVSSVIFVKTDVTSYESVLNLFKTAWSTYGRIDHAVSNAGLVEIGQLFATGVDDANIEEPPPTMVLDVNLKGTLFFTRVAVHFLRKSLAAHEDVQKDASILLVGSVASFEEYPGLFQYSASKHGILGLFRSTRNFLLPTEGIRINTVLPNMTRTQMATGVIALYESLGVPISEPIDVSDVYLHALASDANGEALYVSGSKTYEVEKKLDTVRSDWLGQSVYDELLAGQTALSGGGNWTKRKGGSKDDYDDDQHSPGEPTFTAEKDVPDLTDKVGPPGRPVPASASRRHRSSTPQNARVYMMARSEKKTRSEDFLRRETRPRLLSNYAGAGYELHLCTNCISPFAITKLLAPLLVSAAKTSPINASAEFNEAPPTLIPVVYRGQPVGIYLRLDAQVSLHI
ncbi:hypothetical protein GGR53DRAFT_464026 [Hypoxylon sp. FL1150]|nr:hypothetical protein GGR53DRAFT_464026 [Hypoxylon sp. FL1150]